MTQNATPPSPDMLYLSSRPALPVLAEVAVSFAVLVTKWTVRQRTRQALRQLPPELLKDVGLTREEARHQGTLPFWRP
ncbi:MULTISPECIES: DUF1127 domain-containing protein [Phaeobacter]|uniref:Small protein n=2 Tax=Phaeobacter TaxID=302485 RepID=A0AAC9Z9L5_9RHOB|nr:MULTISPECIES: DUF1127 domain-containing protein [Phaeobacter]AHD09704.1 putative small protein [Phaeobacter gallaeciensis DSM 26640]APG46868.1 putative small protein [Phaeobacter porticola]ATE92968.1 putative small protein [Phaeobacter gallaeciensis]ATE97210.1 putative small protein [Phaeobacter gallaeciensis]ATF01633.1 putative small protein [Phaeobacter gallaeciensis]